MINPFIEDQHFDKKDFATEPLKKGEYENCTFLNCNFSNTNLSEFVFSGCEFKGCNLTMTMLTKAALRDVRFYDCKLVGLQFQHCNEFLFSVRFENCILNLSSFYKLKIKKTTFKNSSLAEVDFTEADLTQSVFDACDLTRAIFESSIIEKVDFRTAFNYSINPEVNKIRKAKFSLNGVSGLLDKYDIEID